MRKSALLFFTYLWNKKFLILFILLLSLASLAFITNINKEPEWVTGVVEVGSVTQMISVSGTMTALKNANLSFPITGVLETVLVVEGDTVMRGSELAILRHDDVKAEYQDAESAVLIAEANRDELIAGIRPEERDVKITNVEIARENLIRVEKEQAERVQNAYRTLLSSDLEAEPEDKEGSYTAPTVTGTYTCETGGSYVLDVYRSDTKSGYSYKLSGLESGTGPLFTDAPGPFGTCGLFIQFTEDVSYANSEWTITVPNQNSSTYLTNLNAYNLALIQEKNAIAVAEEQLTLAEKSLTLDTANPRSEELVRANATVLQAKARLEKIEAQINNHILSAPFDGTITNTELIAGEAVSSDPVITIVSSDAFELTALIPEIDITKIVIGQKAEVLFDAKRDERLSATITYISPLAREIGGVSYFEAKLALDTPTTWLRSGLNADITIILEKHDGVTRIHRRFLTQNGETYSVRVPSDEKTRSVPVDVLFIGNDGFAEITGLNPGDTVIAP